MTQTEDPWRFASNDLPNPRWPAIRVETYQMALCERAPPGAPHGPADDEDQDKGLSALLCEAIKAVAPVGLPRRLSRLEDRSSGLRHSRIIADAWAEGS